MAEGKTNTSVDASCDYVEGGKRPVSRKMGVAIIVAVVVAIAAGSGLWAWHEQPNFCAAICHVPMDGYLATYEQEPGVEGVDKYGETVENTSSMLAVSHRQASGTTCLECHVPTLTEQIAEGVGWIAGNYKFPLDETSLEDLVEARGAPSDSFCMNEDCHGYGREGLVSKTDEYEINPHDSTQHGELQCSECHKAHRASVMFCAKCHDNAVVPEGWVVD